MKSDEKGNVKLADILSRRPESVHKGSQASAKATGEEVNIEDMIEKSGCSKVYYDLEECLGENDRKWQLCQQEVHALKECNTKKKESK